MPFEKSISSLKLTPMTKAEAGQLLKRLLGGYASVNLHDPEVYIAEVIGLLVGYPFWAGERAIAAVRKESPDFIPSVGKLQPHLESEVRVHRYAAEWEEGAQRARLEAQKQIAGPVTPRPTYEELKAKYGPNWGISNPDKPAPPTREECRQKLIAEIGQEAFDAIPDAGYTGEQWKKLHAPKPVSEAAE